MKEITLKLTVGGLHRKNKLLTNEKELKATLIAEGGEGAFYRFNDYPGLGIKIFYTQDHKIKAFRQYNRMKLLEKTGITPKPYAFVTAVFTDASYPAIVMEYIEGKTLYDLGIEYPHAHVYYDKIRKVFDHIDLNVFNVMVDKKGKTYAVDV